MTTEKLQVALALLREWRDGLEAELGEDLALETPSDMHARLERIIALVEAE